MTTTAPLTVTHCTDLYDRYTTAASTVDPDERRDLLAACASPDIEILSPFPYAVRGLDAVAAKLGEVASAMPDGALVIRRSGPIDAHNHVFRVPFENRSGGQVLSTGLHVVEVANGLIARILVFVPDVHPT